MIMAAGFQQGKFATKNGADGTGIVAHHRQAAAPLRPVERECADDDMAAWAQDLCDAACVGLAFCCFNQEMKRGPVVPEIERLLRIPKGYISRNPIDEGSL